MATLIFVTLFNNDKLSFDPQIGKAPFFIFICTGEALPLLYAAPPILTYAYWPHTCRFNRGKYRHQREVHCY